VSAGAGLDVSGEAVPYVAGYGGKDAAQELERCAQAIDAIARRVEEALEMQTDTAGEPSG
jgi:hypothetical protein